MIVSRLGGLLPFHLGASAGSGLHSAVRGTPDNRRNQLVSETWSLIRRVTAAAECRPDPVRTEESMNAAEKSSTTHNTSTPNPARRPNRKNGYSVFRLAYSRNAVWSLRDRRAPRLGRNG